MLLLRCCFFRNSNLKEAKSKKSEQASNLIEKLKREAET